MTDSYAKRIWDLAGDMLGNRALVGRLVKAYGEGAVMSIIGGVASMRNPPADPRAYVTAALASKAKEQGKGPRPNVPDYVATPAKQAKADRAQQVAAAGTGLAAMREKLR